MSKENYEYIAEQIWNRINRQIPIDSDFILNIMEYLIGFQGLNSYMEQIKTYLIFIKRQSIIPKHLNETDQLFFQYLDNIRQVVVAIEYIKYFNNIEKNTLRNKIVQLSFGKKENAIKKLAKQSEFVQGLKKNEAMIQMKYITLSPLKNYPQISSYEEIIQITDLLERETLTNTEMLALCKSYLRPYLSYTYASTEARENNVPPTIYFLEQLKYGKIQIAEIESKSRDLDVVERLRLGLNMSNSEISKVREYESTLKRSLNLFRY